MNVHSLFMVVENVLLTLAPAFPRGLGPMHGEIALKLVDQFTSFLKDTVNLNQTRIDNLESNVDALKTFIRESDWSPRIRGFEEQGSWAHDTIIKPVDGGEFDADLLVMVDAVAGWSAADYIRTLGAIFLDSGVYKDRVKTWDYCVTITYVGDRKVDIAPCVVGRLWQGSYEVCNRRTDIFDRSEPTEYTKWIKEKNSYSGSNSFRKVTRIVKYLRDIKTRFTCSSVLLTTLLGQQIEWTDKDSNHFTDVPTSLKTVFGRLDDWLQARSDKPRVENPKLSSEDFAESLTQEQYTNLRHFINKYRAWIDQAYDMAGRDESIEAWQRVLGEEFAKGEVIRDRKTAAESITGIRESLLSSVAPQSDLVAQVQQYGLSVLPVSFSRQPHMKEPPWPKSAALSNNVQIVASWHSSRALHGTPLSNGGNLRPAGGLWFEARINGGQIVPPEFRVEWRITNTGARAKSLGQERGGFYPSDDQRRRWEGLQYRGVHMAEAFIIRNADNLLVGQSAPFYVVIE